MDKYEYQLKLDQINKLVGRNDYATAMKIANNIDWRRVRSVNTLSMIADIYEKNKEYEESRELLIMAYERAPVGRMIAYKLSDLCVKLGDYDQAIEYYKDFVHSAPKDPAKLILKYKIFRGKGAALKDQIAILEEYRMQEYEEEWALELAYLYQEAGEIEKCVEECDQLMLWFNDGQYVLKAMELKMQYAELTPAQMEKYELRMNRTKLVDARDDIRRSEEHADGGLQDETQMYEQGYAEGYQELYYGGQEPGSEMAESEELPQIQDPESLMSEEQLSIEDDGQMKMEMPVYQPVEKQITGQMTIQEILEEWEKVKQETPQENSGSKEIPEEKKPEPEEELQEDVPEPEEESQEPQKIEMPEEELPEIDEEDAEEELLEETVELEELPEIAMPEGFEETETEELPEDAEPEAEEIQEEIPEDIPEDIPEAEEEPQQIKTPEEEVSEEEIELEELPEIAMPEGFEETEELPEETEVSEAAEVSEEADYEDEDAAEDLEAKIINSLSSGSLALADADDGTLDGRIGDEDIKKYTPKRSARREVRRGTLTEEQKKMFTYFTPVHGMSDQLWTALENEKECMRGGTSNIGNILIMGEPGTGKTMLAVNLVKAIQKTRNESSGRLAKISAETLNEKDVSAVVQKLNGGALIIERASELTNESVIRLEMSMQGQTGELLFILEDERQALKRFMKLHPKLAQMFTTKIVIPIFTNDELVEFGKCYAYELEYSIDEMAMLALYNRIGNMQRDDYDVSVTDVKKIIDAAIEKNERGGIGKFFGSLTKKRYDDEDCIILREKDFEE